MVCLSFCYKYKDSEDFSVEIIAYLNTQFAKHLLFVRDFLYIWELWADHEKGKMS